MVSEHTITELLRQARNGSVAARDRLIEQLLPLLARYVRRATARRVRQLESHSDLLQTVCREVVEDLDGFTGESADQLIKWVRVVALNKLRMKGRYHAAARRDAGQVQEIEQAAEEVAARHSGFTPSQHAVANEAKDRFRAALSRLNEDERVCLELALAGHSHRQIAGQLKRSEVATRKLLSRAKSRLAAMLGVGD